MTLSTFVRAVLTASLMATSAAAQTRIGPPMLTTPGADEWYLRTPDSVSLYIREFGQGEPVIVVDGGWGMDHGYMFPALNGLENVAHVVIYDQRGSLRSPAAATKISVQSTSKIWICYASDSA